MELPTPQDLRERRTTLELTQSDLADAADVSQPLIARIEGGDVDPRLSTLRRIVNALQEAEGKVVRASDLMNETVISVAPDDAVHGAVESDGRGGVLSSRCSRTACLSARSVRATWSTPARTWATIRSAM